MRAVALFLFAAASSHAAGGLVAGGAQPAGGAQVVSSVTITNLGVGGVVFSSTPAAGRLSVDSSNLFWDDTENRLGVGVSTPATTLDVSGIAQFGGGSTKSTFTVAGVLNLASALSVGNGGTGVTSLVSGGVLFGGSPITASAVLSNGQLLIGDGTTAPTLATLTATTNETEITNGAGSITLGIVDAPSFGNGATKSTFSTTGALTLATATLLTIDSATVRGNLGIGNAAPSYPLHVTGDAYTTGQSIVLGTFTVLGTGAIFNKGTNDTLTFGGDPRINLNVTDAISGLKIVAGSQPINLSTNSGGGSIVVGGDLNLTYTAVPAVAASTIKDTPQMLFSPKSWSGSASVTNFQGSIYGNQTLTASPWGGLSLGGTAGADHIFILSTGLVGLGTVAPTTLLHMSSGTITVDGNTQLGIDMLNGTLKPWTRTVAQIDGLTPGTVGQYIHCSNCTLPGLCVSTGTAVAQWRKIESSTLGCGTGN